MGGSLTAPSWLVFMSHSVWIFLPSLLFSRPEMNLTTTLALSTGFPLGLVTTIFRLVWSAAANVTVAQTKRNSSFRMGGIIACSRSGGQPVTLIFSDWLSTSIQTSSRVPECRLWSSVRLAWNSDGIGFLACPQSRLRQFLR